MHGDRFASIDPAAVATPQAQAEWDRYCAQNVAAMIASMMGDYFLALTGRFYDFQTAIIR